MADALASLVVRSLGSMTVQELSLLVGVNEDLEKLSRTFESLQAALSDAEKRQVKDELVRNWLGKLKDVAYDMDDVLEEWKVVIDACDDGISSGYKKVCVQSFSPCFFFDRVRFRVKTSRRIKEISRRLDQIKADKDSFSFREVTEESRVVELDMMETSSLIDETEIFGRDQDKERIVSWLVSEESSNEENIPVISLVGMVGIGKTALAQLVCRDERIKRHFDKSIWVSLPDDFNEMKIYLAITKITQSTFLGFNSLENLQSTVQDVQPQKQFLLVLDGIRNVDEARWERFMMSLKGAPTGSRILVTTRNEHVTKSFSMTLMHELQPLFENDCWSLFSHRAFSGGRRGDECVKLEALGREIVNKCQGIPLLLKAIGSTLRGKRVIQDWQSVLEEGKWELLGAEKIAPALLVSFHDLPQHLKQCFAFCFIFPKGHLIEKDKVIKLWMAQGFIPLRGRGEMERLGSSYFDDLMRRSLFQFIETDEDGDAKYCIMQEMIHDLCESVMSECLIIQKETLKSQLAKARHASWICNGDVECIPSFIHKASNLRTLLLVGWSKIPSVSHRFFNSLKRLRALDLSGSRIKKLPNSLQNLKLLRYLDFSATKIQELPEFISSLCLLQTLKLNHCYKLTKLPKGIVKLIKLRHLETEGTCLEYLPEGMGRLTSLRTLTKFVPGVGRGCKITELKDLNLLQGELEITFLDRVASKDEANEAKLENKQNLQTLQLSCAMGICFKTQIRSEVELVEGVFEGLRPHTNLRDLTLWAYIGRQFPSWMEDCSLYSNLTKVQLSYCRCRQMPALGKLPSLQWLKIMALFEVRQVGSEFCGNSHGGVTGTFPKLEILLFESMEIWEEWKLNVEAGSIPSLFQLCISSCQKLKALPELQQLTSLQELKISNCPILHNRCQKEVGEDWNKIAHIPNVTIDGRKMQ